MNILEAYVDQMNRWNAIFKSPAVNFPLTQQDVEDLSNKLGGELSPENLHCDGEISPAQARKKYNYLMTVQAQLETYCANNSLTFKEPIY